MPFLLLESLLAFANSILIAGIDQPTNPSINTTFKVFFAHAYSLFNMAGPVERVPTPYRLLSADLAGNEFVLERPFVCQVRAAHDATSTTSLSLSNYSTELDSVPGMGLSDLFFFLLILMAVVLAMTTAYVIIDCHMMRRRFLATRDQGIRLDHAAEDNAAIRCENAGHRAMDPVDPVREGIQAPPEARPVEHDAASSSSANINGVGSETSTASTIPTSSSRCDRASRREHLSVLLFSNPGSSSSRTHSPATPSMSPVAIAASFKEAAKALAAGDEEPLTCAGSQYGLENSSTITRSQPQSGLPTQISKRCRPDTASYRETCIGKEKEHGVWPLATPSSSGSYISSIGSGIDSSSNTISSFGIGIDSNSSSVGRSDISTITTSSSNDAAFVFNGFGPMPGTLDLSQPGYDSEDDFIVVDEGEIMPAPELLSRWSNKWQRLSLRRKLWLKVESSKRSEQKRPLLMR